MKPIKVLLVFLSLIAVIATQSCNVKKGCRGHIKHKLPNGIWL